MPFTRAVFYITENAKNPELLGENPEFLKTSGFFPFFWQKGRNPELLKTFGGDNVTPKNKVFPKVQNFRATLFTL